MSLMIVGIGIYIEQMPDSPCISCINYIQI